MGYFISNGKEVLITKISYFSYRVGQYCLRLCQEHWNIDAASFLLGQKFEFSIKTYDPNG